MPLTQQELRELSRAIDHRYAELVQDARDDLLRAGRDDLPEQAPVVLDPAERSVNELLSALDTAGAHRHMHQVRALIDARNRMKHGTYGTCVDCGEDIGIQRLKAEPAALRCMDCQQIHDRDYDGADLPTL